MSNRYGVTKLLETLIVRQLAAQTTANASGKPSVIINCLNPGFCVSEIDREASSPIRSILYVMRKLMARTTEVGSRTLVAGILADEKSHGEYMTDGHVAP